MYIMKTVHDQLGHHGMYATKMLIKERFWWPEMERDIAWYISTCYICQECHYIIHGEYWCFLFVVFDCFQRISMCSCHD